MKGDSIEQNERSHAFRPAFVDSIITGMSTTNSRMISRSSHVRYKDIQCCAVLMLSGMSSNDEEYDQQGIFKN
jgi:hypothetical protein